MPKEATSSSTLYIGLRWKMTMADATMAAPEKA